MPANYYKDGAHNVICDKSGFKVKSTDTRMERSRFGGKTNRVDKRFWDPVHPQEFLRAIHDRQSVADPRPEGPDRFLGPGEITADDL